MNETLITLTHRFLRFASGLVLFFTVLTDAAAQVPANPDSALVAALAEIEGMPLPLDQAVQLAMQNATAILEAEAMMAAARGRRRSERGAFDPEFFVTGERFRDETPTSSPFSGADVLVNNQTTFDSGVRTTLTTGTEISASLQTIRTRTNSAFAALNPQYSSFGSIRVRQPLLSGGGIGADTEYEAARLGEAAAEALYVDAVNTVRAAVEALYWDIYAAERDLAVQTLIRRRAEALLDEVQLRAKAGLVGPNQVENARVFLAEQELSEIDRREFVETLSDELSSLIGMRPTDGHASFRPIDEPPVTVVVEDVDALVEKAIESNQILSAARADLDQARVRARAARRNRLPTVDLIGSLGANGLAGEAQDVIFGSDTLRSANAGNFFDAVSQIRDFEFPRWSVGLNVTIPIGSRRWSGRLRQREAEVDAAEQRYVAAERAVEEQIRRAHRELMNGTERLEIARRGVTASQEQVRIGLIEYRNGRTTAFELVRLGADLASAQQRYSQALVRTAKAAASLARLTSGAYPFATSQSIR